MSICLDGRHAKDKIAPKQLKNSVMTLKFRIMHQRQYTHLKQEKS